MKFKKLICFLLLLLLYVSLNAHALNYQYIARINNAKILLETAVSQQQRETGLMYRKHLKSGTGMLFMFDKKDYVNFWMKNVKIPLDIVFIDDNKIVKVYNNVKACYKENCPIYPSTVPVNKVIETNEGFCLRNKIQEGQTVKIYPLKK